MNLKKDVVEEKNETKNNLKNFILRFKISLIIFIIILIIHLFFSNLYLKDDSSMSDIYLVFDWLFITIPSLSVIILSIINLVLLFKEKSSGIIIDKKAKILIIVNFLIMVLTPCFVLSFLILEDIKSSNYNIKMNKKLYEVYNNSYEVLDTCLYSNGSGGSNYVTYLLKLNNFEYPILTYFDLTNDSYSDNYDELNKARLSNYQTYIDNVFDDKTIALMSISDDEKKIQLEIFMSNDKLNDKTLLKNNIVKMIDNYQNKFETYDIDLSIYFANEIQIENKEDYFEVLLANKENNGCFNKTRKKINKNDFKVLYIYFNKFADISGKIKESVDELK